MSKQALLKNYKDFLCIDIDNEKLQKIARKFSEMVLNEITKVPFVDGAKQLIEKNHKRYLMFISSATPSDELKFICNKRRIEKYFKGIFGSPDTKSMHIATIKNTWSLDNREIVFIGDSLSDLNAAKAHNISFIARITKELKGLINEKYKIDDLNKLDEIISNINDKI